MDINIPTKARFEKLVVDNGSESQFSHIDFLSQPFLSVNSSGRVILQTPSMATINLRILPISYDSLFDQTRMQITNDSELILSHQDSYSLGNQWSRFLKEIC